MDPGTSRQLICNKPGNRGTLTIVVDLVKSKEIGIFPSFKAVYADIKQWERPIDISPQRLAALVKENMTESGYKFFLSSHLPDAFYTPLGVPRRGIRGRLIDEISSELCRNFKFHYTPQGGYYPIICIKG